MVEGERAKKGLEIAGLVLYLAAPLWKKKRNPEIIIISLRTGKMHCAFTIQQQRQQTSNKSNNIKVHIVQANDREMKWE